MKNLMAIVCGTFLLIGCQGNAQDKKTETKPATAVTTQKRNMKQSNSIHQFKAETLSGETLDFATLKGKKVLIVNTASKCGLTPQYEQLEAIYEQYKDQNFVIIGFPANNFASQEPGTNEEIGAFCQKNYGVTFPMMGKISVKGEDMSEIYKFLTEKKLNGVQDSEVKWNFQKYLIDEEGKLVKVISPETLPTDAAIVSWIKS